MEGMKGPFGFVVVDKPRGVTSHDCVNHIRKIFNIKRVGHGGTLDPSVTGVLPIALGSATRLLNFLPGEKTYKGIIQLGKQTNTDDLEGSVISQVNWPELGIGDLEKYLNQFKGPIEQRPPQISSVHVNGVRAYKKASQGEVFELPKRNVIIHELQLLNWNPTIGQLEIKVHCSAGTYIRSLARDLGNIIGCGGCLSKLRRTQALGFLEEEAEPLPDIKNKNILSSPLLIINPLKALGHMPMLKLKSEKDQKDWRTGRAIVTDSNKLQDSIDTGSFVLVVDCQGQIAGIAKVVDRKTLNPKVVFNAIG